MTIDLWLLAEPLTELMLYIMKYSRIKSDLFLAVIYKIFFTTAVKKHDVLKEEQLIRSVSFVTNHLTKQSNKLFRLLHVKGIHAVLLSPTFPSLTVSLPACP